MATKKTQAATKPLMLIVLDRGWVFVGRVTEGPSQITIDDAGCVRFWGTTKGIGQLASEGPLSATKIDPAPRIVAPGRAVIFLMACNEERWKNYR